MRLNFKKTTAILMSALAISSAVFPAAAANVQSDALVVAENATGIEPRVNTISLNTTSYSSSIKVSWGRVSGATKYIATCGSQSKTITSHNIDPYALFTGLSSKTSYRITVTAYNSSGTKIATGSITTSTK